MCVFANKVLSFDVSHTHNTPLSPPTNRAPVSISTVRQRSNRPPDHRCPSSTVRTVRLPPHRWPLRCQTERTRSLPADCCPPPSHLWASAARRSRRFARPAAIGPHCQTTSDGRDRFAACRRCANREWAAIGGSTDATRPDRRCDAPAPGSDGCRRSASLRTRCWTVKGNGCNVLVGLVEWLFCFLIKALFEWWPLPDFSDKN